MELAVLAGVAFLGYKAVRRGSASRYTPDVLPLAPHQNGYPAAAQTDVGHIMAMDARAAAGHWDRTVVPFFKSEKTQFYSDAYSQRKLESFTGTDDAMHRPKNAAEPLFAPAESRGFVTSSGMTAPASATRASLVAAQAGVSTSRNNELPFEQTRVGPGVGVGIDVVAADGFHPMHRIMPTAVIDGAPPRHALPGRLNHGAKPTTKRPEELPEMAVMRPSTVWTLDDRPMEKGRAAVTAPTAVSDGAPLLRPGDRAAEGYIAPGYTGRGAAHAGTGSRLERQVLDVPIINHASGVPGGPVARPTELRDTDRVHDASVGMATGPRAPLAKTTILARPTNRQDVEYGYTTPGYGTRADRSVLTQGGRPATIRETQDAPGVRNATPAMPAARSAVPRVPAYQAESKARHMAYVTSGAMQGTFTPNTSGMRLAERTQPGPTVLPAAQVYAGVYPLESAQSTTTYNKLPVINPRATAVELGVARTVLATNELMATQRLSD